MPQPTANSAFIDPLLGDVAVAYMQDATQFISGRVFPTVPCQYPHGQYDNYDRADWYRIAAKPRGPGEESAGGGYTISQSVYSIVPEAVHSDLDAQLVASAMPPEDPRKNKTRWVTLQLLLRKEVKWATAFFKAGVWTVDMTGVTGASSGNNFTQWSNHTTSTPLEDLETQIAAMEGLTGYKPNRLVLGRRTFSQLKNHPEIKDAIKYSQVAVITEELLAALFGIDQVLVARGIQTTSAEEQVTPGVHSTYDFMVNSKGALLCYANNAPSIEEPSAGYHFAWTGYLGASAEGSVVYEIPVPLRKAVRIEGELATSPTIVAPDLGCFFASAVA
jgi:hypothetical protein